jgi:hypothetical protein
LSRNDSRTGLTSGNRLKPSPVNSPNSHLVNAPVPVKTSSGGEPLAVVVGQGVVALVAAFEPRDGDHWDAEMSRDGGQGDVFSLSGRPKVAVVVDRGGSGQQSEYFTDDGALEQPQTSFLVRPLAAWR